MKANDHMEAEKLVVSKSIGNKKPFYHVTAENLYCRCGAIEQKTGVGPDNIIHCSRCKRVYWISTVVYTVELTDKYWTK